ncbi:MAG: hypothetical protein JWN56_821 [Sphingobacteriales bacterium]|nr:hypothetical protein [Sphingobacteriales bacterium]
MAKDESTLMGALPAIIHSISITKSSLSTEQVKSNGQSVKIFLISNTLLLDQDWSLKQISEALNMTIHENTPTEFNAHESSNHLAN